MPAPSPPGAGFADMPRVCALTGLGVPLPTRTPKRSPMGHLGCRKSPSHVKVSKREEAHSFSQSSVATLPPVLRPDGKPIHPLDVRSEPKGCGGGCEGSPLVSARPPPALSRALLLHDHPSLGESRATCHVWMSPADQGLFLALRGSWVRSCLRPFARRIGSAGPDVVR